MKAGDAAYIYRDGLLVGGLEGHRAHVHLVHAVGEWTDESRGVRCQGIKRECDAYVIIDAKKFLTLCTLDDQPVTMFENTNGVVLTAGAGLKEDGTDLPRACIPPGCIESIRNKRSGDVIPRTQVIAGSLVLREAGSQAEAVVTRRAVLQGADADAPDAAPEAESPAAETSGASPKAAPRVPAAPRASAVAAPREETRQREEDT